MNKRQKARTQRCISICTLICLYSFGSFFFSYLNSYVEFAHTTDKVFGLLDICFFLGYRWNVVLRKFCDKFLDVHLESYEKMWKYITQVSSWIQGVPFLGATPRVAPVLWDCCGRIWLFDYRSIYPIVDEPFIYNGQRIWILFRKIMNPHFSPLNWKCNTSANQIALRWH